MNTRLLDVNDMTRHRGYLKAAAEALRKGEVVAFPTETVYGVGADAENEGAVSTLYDIKNRPHDKEFARLISRREDLRNAIGGEIPLYADMLIEEFWPGPLTIVLSGRDGRDTGVRLPAHRVAQDLVRLAGVPVLATSANISGRPPATNAQEVLEYFSGKIGIILDGGPSEIQVPSTVVRVTGETCAILREGAISGDRIMDCIGVKVEVSQ